MYVFILKRTFWAKNRPSSSEEESETEIQDEIRDLKSRMNVLEQELRRLANREKKYQNDLLEQQDRIDSLMTDKKSCLICRVNSGVRDSYNFFVFLSLSLKIQKSRNSSY